MRLVAAAVLLLVVAGCGSTHVADPARVAPASTSAFVRLDRGAGLAEAERLVSTVSTLPAALAVAESASGVPAGPGRVYLARLPQGWVALVQPADAKAFARRLGALPSARVRGWTVVARTRAALDAVRHARRRLAERGDYRAPPEGAAGAWAGAAAAGPLGLPRGRDLRWATASLDADGLTIRERAASTGPQASSASAAGTTGAAVAFGLGPWVPPARVLEPLAAAYGLDLRALRRTLPAGSVVELRAAPFLPELGLVGSSPDAPSVARRLGTLLVRGATFPEPATVDGVPLERFVLGAGEVDDGAWHRTFAAATGPASVVAAHRGGADLGLPSWTQGWLAVDVPVAEAIAPIFDRFAGGNRAERLVGPLRPLATLVAWQARSGGVETTRFLVRAR